MKVFWILALLMPLQSIGGVMNGGGGQGVVCRDSNGNITSAKILDLWEAQALLQIEIPDSLETVETQLARAIKKFSRVYPKTENASFADSNGLPMTFAEHIERSLKHVASIFKDSGLEYPDTLTKVIYLNGAGLALTDDSFAILKPLPPCQIEQIVTYDDYSPNVVLVSNDIYSKLSNTHKAALIFHEAVYKFLRSQTVAIYDAVNDDYLHESFEMDSRRSRRIVGVSFSKIDFLGRVPQQKAIERLICRGFDGFDKTQHVMYLSRVPKIESFDYPLKKPSGPFSFKDSNGESLVVQVARIGKIPLFDVIKVHPMHSNNVLTYESLFEKIKKSSSTKECPDSPYRPIFYQYFNAGGNLSPAAKYVERETAFGMEVGEHLNNSNCVSFLIWVNSHLYLNDKIQGRLFCAVDNSQD
jgi:hypothetical protein